MTGTHTPDRTAGPDWTGSPDKRLVRVRRKSAVIMAGSVAAHAVVFTVLGLGWLDDDNESSPVPPYHPIYIDNEPWPFLRGTLRKPASPSSAAETNSAAEAQQSASHDAGAVTSGALRIDQEARPTAPLPSPAPGRRDAPWAVVPEGRNAVVGRALRNGALGCRSGFSDPVQQAQCDQSFGMAASRAAPILGTDDPARDARFAAEGQAELDAYENLRAPLKPPQPCAGADMMGRCPAVFTFPLFGKKF